MKGKSACGVCGQMAFCRMDDQDTAFGPLMRPTCETCYAKDVAERRAEGKRFHYRPKIVPWWRLEELYIDVEA